MPARLKIEYLASAQDDLEDVFHYIAKDNRDAAIQILSEFDREITRLEENPLLGSVPTRMPQLEKLGWRFLDVKGYLVFYIIESDKIEIRNIITGWMTWAKWQNKAIKLNLSPKPLLFHQDLMELLKQKITSLKI